MANTVIALKKSATPTAAPTNLANGELAINYADGILYYKAANGTIASIQSLEGNSFGTVNANGTLLVSDTVGDFLTMVSGNNIAIIGDAVNDRLTVALTNDVNIPGKVNVGGNFTHTGGDFFINNMSGAGGSSEGGEIKLANASQNQVLSGPISIDIYENKLRFFETNSPNRGAFMNLAAAAVGVGTDLLAAASSTDVSARVTANAAFLHANSAFDKANGALPNVSGVSFNGNLTVSQNLTSDRVFTLNNGNGENFKIGDDAWFGDTNLVNTVRLKGQQNASIGYIIFGPNDGKVLGRDGTGPLTYDGGTVWHSNNDGVGSGLDADFLDGQHGSYYGIASDVTAVFARANIIFANANTVMISAQSAFTQANIAYAHANTAHASANAGQATGNAAFVQANTATALATAAQSIANLAFIHANNAYATVNSAFARANAALPNTSGVTFNGNLNVSQNVSADKFIATNNGNSENFRVGDDAWIGDINVSNTIKIKGVQNNQIAYISFGMGDTKALGRDGTGHLTYDNNIVWHQGNDGSGSGLDADLLDGQNATYYGKADDVTAAFALGNNAFARANTANITADRAWNHANAAFITANIAFANANTVMISAQAAFTVANAAFLHANASYIFANSAHAIANLAFAHANAAFLVANTSGTEAEAAFLRANLAHAHANAAFATVNSAFGVANAALPKTGGTITGSLAVTGSLTVAGNVFLQDAETIRVSDPLLYLAGNNYSSDIVDIGFVANYVNATGQNVHTGLFRDATIKEYYLFEGYDKEPVPNHIDTAANNFTVSVLNATIKTSNLILGGTNTIPWITATFNHANAAFLVANTSGTEAEAAFLRANLAHAHANAAFLVANTSGTEAEAAFLRANLAHTHANAAYLAANTARTVVNDTVNATRYLMFANGLSGTSSSNVALGLSFNPSSNTLNINGPINAITKSFVIPHPVKDGMFLRYGSLEGPENGVYVRGKLEGKSIIELPDYWWNLIDENTITVNLTPYGRSQDIWVQSTSSHFIHLNQPADCFFTVFAERKDVDKLVVEY